MKHLLYIILILAIVVYIFFENYIFKKDEFEISGKAPKGYKIEAKGFYASMDMLCSHSAGFNNGGTAMDTIHFNGDVVYNNGKYQAKLYKHFKIKFCNWEMINAEVSIVYPKKDLNTTHVADYPLYTLTLEKDIRGTTEENLTCIRNDTFVHYNRRYTKTSLKCAINHLGKLPSYRSRYGVSIDANLTKLKKITLNFKVKKEIVMTQDPKPPVVHKYKIDKSSNKLFYNMYLDEGDYNISVAKNILEHNSSHVTDSGYSIFQYALAGDFARNKIDFPTIKFLAKHGYNIAKYQQEYYVDKKITSIIKKFDIEEEPWCQGYDYATLPEAIKQKLKEKGITLKNYYSKRERKDSLLYDIGGYYNDESPKIIKWMLSQGYRPKKGELEWALFNALWGEVKNPVKLIKEYIALGANLHNPKVAFPLMKTMLWRFDDIKTLKTLVNAGVNINATDQYGQTIIFNHAYNYKPYHGKCNAKVIREYMKLGLDVKHKSIEGETFIDSDKGWGCGVKSFKELDENNANLGNNSNKDTYGN